MAMGAMGVISAMGVMNVMGVMSILYHLKVTVGQLLVANVRGVSWKDRAYRTEYRGQRTDQT